MRAHFYPPVVRMRCSALRVSVKAKLGLLVVAATLSLPTLARESADVVSAPVAIKTSSGRVQGQRQGETESFLGIPYAKPPVGSARWRPPQPLPAWRGTRQAQKFGPSCYQEWPAKGFGPYTTEFVSTPEHAEDCLYLNVWRPASGAADLPILFWIHGGGFGGGSGAIEIYNGAHLASRGVIVVTINYRVGPFGFMALGELTKESGSSGNYGLLDMIAALKWVHTNARVFGGDPRRITIAGQSAGAIAVNDLVVAPQARGLFTAAIAMSGSGMGIDAIPLHQAEENGAKFAARLGVGSVAQLRGLSAAKIQSAIPTFFGPGKGNEERIPFRPVLDGKLLTADPMDGATPPASVVPLMTGFTTEEFVPPTPVTQQDFEANTRRRFGAHADDLLRLYPHKTEAEATVSSRELSRDTYMASLWIWTDSHIKLSGAPIYTYLYNHPAPVPSSGGTSWGAFHTSEVPYVFGILNRERRAYTDADTQVSEQMQVRWLNFMRMHDPNQQGMPEWKPAEPHVQAVMALGDASAMVMPVSAPERMAALLRYVADGGRLGLL